MGPARRRGGSEAVAAKDVGDASLRHRNAELLQLADDAQVAPPGVLPGEAHDQLDGLVGKGWPAGPAVRVGPASADQSAMPAEDRLGRNEERRPPLAWDQLGQGGDERPVRPGEAGTGDLAAGARPVGGEARGSRRPWRRRPSGWIPKQFDHTADQAVEEAERHGRGALPADRAWSTWRSSSWTLHLRFPAARARKGFVYNMNLIA